MVLATAGYLLLLSLDLLPFRCPPADSPVLHQSGIEQLVYSRDGKRLASLGLDGTVLVREVATGKVLLSRKKKRDSRVSGLLSSFSLAFCSGENLLICASSDKILSLVKVQSGKEVSRIEIQDAICEFALSADERFLVVRTWGFYKGQGMLHFYHLPTRRLLHQMVEPDDGSEMRMMGGRMAFHPDTSILATTHGSKQVHLWDAASGKLRQSFTGHETAVLGIAFSPDGAILVSGAGGVTRHGHGFDETIRFWDVRSGRQLLRIEVGEGIVYSVAYSPDGRLVASSSSLATQQLWEVTTGKEVLRFQAPDRQSCSLAFSPDGKTLACGMSDGRLLTWDLAPAGWQRPEAKPTKSQLEALWRDMRDEKAPKAYRALWTLSATPEQTMSFLQPRLHPIPTEKPERIRQLIADLDSNEFAKREAASRELARLGRQAETALRETYKTTPSEEVRSRIEPLLKVLDTWAIKDPKTLQVLRAIWVLERIGNKEAGDLLERLAQGAPTVRQTQEARAALARLSKRDENK